MTPSELAAALGRRGGRARAARLTAARRRQIAIQGAAARRASLDAARRITSNFRYLEAVRQLAPDVPSPKRVSTCRGPLPGVYPDGHGR
jgi:hypothetical protein